LVCIGRKGGREEEERRWEEEKKGRKEGSSVDNSCRNVIYEACEVELGI
jgi:hypothetical protein